MPMSAHRWVMTAPKAPLERVDFDPLPAGAGEVVVEIAGCGVCHTDLGYYYDGVRTNHPLPLTLGHEISGRVVACGPGAEPWQDRAVIVPAVIPCGTCALCRSGRGTICRTQKMPGNDIEGGFASHIRVPVVGLCPVDEGKLGPAGLGLADVSVIADAVTTPYQAVKRAGVTPGSLAVVIGAGGVGGYAVQIAAAFGATVAAVDVDPAKLEQIAAAGASLTLNARDHDERALKKALQDFARQKNLPSVGWFIFECSGTAAGQLTAYSLINHGATVSIVGFTRDKVEVRLSNLMAYDARCIGNWGCPPDLYPEALALVLDGRVRLGPFVERRPLETINAVFADVHDHRIKRRVVLVPGKS
ncbi:MAG: 6-hydroxycyclohex-1-ene-1-carbonyl-CoA dehydrogenase [Alphaproteobacteria bacterium]|nr:6-hydroxycyclohex-1-ene-1-carbonyl-CoA dehydrogenase [Alphaproteobacteria bacterium]